MTQSLARAEPLSDRQLRARLEIATGKGFSLEGATRDQLNMVYLVSQRYALDPLTHVGLFQGKPWYTLDGRVYLARRHPQYRGYHTRPLTADEKDAWGYRSDDLVVECTMHTRDWGDITARGKVTAAERNKNTPTGSHPQEMAEKRAIARASRMAFGLEIPDETDADDADAQRNEPRKLGADNQRYTEIFGADEASSPYELPSGRVVDRVTGEVLEDPDPTSAQELTDPGPSGAAAGPQSPPSSPPTSGFVAHTTERGQTIHMPRTDDTDRAAAIVDKAHTAAARRAQEIAEIDRQRREEGLL
jgi:hypothetical protein